MVVGPPLYSCNKWDHGWWRQWGVRTHTPHHRQYDALLGIRGWILRWAGVRPDQNRYVQTNLTRDYTVSWWSETEGTGTLRYSLTQFTTQHCRARHWADFCLQRHDPSSNDFDDEARSEGEWRLIQRDWDFSRSNWRGINRINKGRVPRQHIWVRCAH